VAKVHKIAAERDIRALKVFEDQVGGRDKLIEHLSHATLTDDQTYLVGMIADPRNSRKSLATIAALAQVHVGQLYKFFQEAGFVKAQLAAFEKIWKGLPAVAEDVMAKAVPRQIECPTCRGVGELTYEVKQEGWKKGDPIGEEIKACWNCQGEKKVWVEPDLETQKVALQIGKVLTPGGVQVGVQVNTQQNFSGGLSSDHLRDFRAASDRVLFPTKRRRGEEPPAEAEEPIEAEVVEP
jgi:hypothetical protein